jgi:flagellar biosynthetic protein FliP
LTLSPLLGLFGGLALVLGLIALLIRPFRALSLRAGISRGGPELEILARTALAPRQGLAVVRFGSKKALVSYGEGGVRFLMEGDEDAVGPGEATMVEEAADASLPGPVSAQGDGRQHLPDSPGGALWNRVRTAAKAAGFSLMILGTLCFSSPAEAEAQIGSAMEAAEQLTNQAVEQAVSQVEGQEALPEASSDAAQGLGLLGRSFPSMDVKLGEGEDALRVSGPVGTVIFIGFLTLLPTVVLLMTGFTRILVVLHLLRQALGTQAAPPAHLLAAMALLLTGFVMAPTLGEVNRTALAPWTAGEINEAEMLQAASVPFRSFMLGVTREQDLANFIELQGGPAPGSVDDVPIMVVTSAFVTSELRNAFQMGFALFLPFVVIDLVVASVLMSMGMFMLPPVMVSLPFKLLLFVLVDGWSLVVGGIVRSFQGG